MASKLKIKKRLPSYLKRSSNGGLLVGFIYVISFMSILFLALWQTFESEKKNHLEIQLMRTFTLLKSKLILLMRLIMIL